MGKKYDTSHNLNDFIMTHNILLPEIIRVTKNSGNICLQVGYFVKDGNITPLDYLIHDIMSKFNKIYLRNRIIWAYGHGLHSKKRFSGRHEIILWYSKGENNYFDLDSVRIPQKYPGKKHYKGEKRGEYSGNPLGKNPSDIWEIPNVKANHPEKTNHPCQFPVALAQRLIKALSPHKGIILDPFMGSGSTGVAAILEGRKFVGAETKKQYYKLAINRFKKAKNGELVIRPLNKPIVEPNPNLSVSKKPVMFK